MAEIKSLAGVSEFPFEDARMISNLVSAYNSGANRAILTMMSSMSTLEKYPDLFDVWDELLIKYKKLGLFHKWNVEM